MHVHLLTPESPPPVERAFVLSMTIASFRGRREVEVHLFRAGWPENEAGDYPWDELLEQAPSTEPAGAEDQSRAVVLEAFTAQERDRILEFVQNVYADRVTSVMARPLSWPVPAGLIPLSSVHPGKTVGIIDFAKIPRYDLPIPLKGLYDLAQHAPLVEPGTAED